jgi:nucleoside-diphosphate-sugar epimerase
VLVTGAGGFIGANLVRRLLQDGHQVHALVRPGSDLTRLVAIRDSIQIHEADLLICRQLRRELAGTAFDAVCHLACFPATPRHPVPLRRGVHAEATMALNLFEAVRQTSWQRLICVSSSYEYGPKRRPLREFDPVVPASARGLSRAVSSLILESLVRQAGREFVRLRVFSVYGPWQQASRLVPQAIFAALAGRPLPLTPQPTFRDFVFVDDVSEAIARALAEPQAARQTLNIGSGRLTTNHAVVREIERLTGRRVQTAAEAHPFTEADSVICTASIAKAGKILGWRPRHSLRQGLRITVDWFRQLGAPSEWYCTQRLRGA